MDELFIWIIAIVAISLGVCGVAGAVIMNGRGNEPVLGFILGALFGPIGLVMALLIRPSEKHEVERQLRIEMKKEDIRGNRYKLLEYTTAVDDARFIWECRICKTRGFGRMKLDEAKAAADSHICK